MFLIASTFETPSDFWVEVCILTEIEFDSFWKKIRNGDRNTYFFLFAIWMQLSTMQPV